MTLAMKRNSETVGCPSIRAKALSRDKTPVQCFSHRVSSRVGGWRTQFEKTSWVAFPFDFGFGKGGPLFARGVVADLQVGAFALRRRRSASRKTGHNIGGQRGITSLKAGHY